MSDVPSTKWVKAKSLWGLDPTRIRCDDNSVLEVVLDGMIKSIESQDDTFEVLMHLSGYVLGYRDEKNPKMYKVIKPPFPL
jgi:hypothetical protein